MQSNVHGLKGHEMLRRKLIKDSIPTPYTAVWFGLKWNMIFVMTGLLCFTLFRADRVVLGFITGVIFLFFFVRDCFRFSRRGRKGIVRRPTKLS